MKIKARLYATLRNYAPQAKIGETLEVELPDGSQIIHLIEYFKMPRDLVKLAYVNGIYQELDFELHDNDEIGIFPPIGGGTF